MFTETRRQLRLLLLTLAFVVLIPACNRQSVRPDVPPTTPEVRCKQPAGRDVPPEPKDDEWVAWVPASPLMPYGAAVLSEKAVEWIVDVLGVVRQEKGLRKVEHDCLDAAERKGLIQQ